MEGGNSHYKNKLHGNNDLRPALGVSHVQSKCNKTKEQVHIVYYNARSLLPKLDELQAVSEVTRPDIICIVETLLDNSVSDNELCLSDYQLFRLD